MFYVYWTLKCTQEWNTTEMEFSLRMAEYLKLSLVLLEAFLNMKAFARILVHKVRFLHSSPHYVPV